MTGNVVLLAFGAAGAQGLPVLAPTVSLVVFLAGATAGGRLAASMAVWGAETRIRFVSRRFLPSVDAVHALADRPPPNPPAGPPAR